MALTKKNLRLAMEAAVKEDAAVFAVVVEIPGQEVPEVIINLNASFENKFKYYEATYDDELNHVAAPGVKIVAFTHADDLAQVQDSLFDTDLVEIDEVDSEDIVDYDEVNKFIQEKTGVSAELLAAIQEAEIDFLVEKGIVSFTEHTEINE